jgi:hypothetical protein
MTQALQSFEVQTEDGQTITMSVARQAPGEGIREEMTLDSKYQGVEGDSGRKPTVFNSKAKMIKMYRGYVESRVPRQLLGWMLDHGFTIEPTAVAPPLNFPCGVMLQETGKPCPKRLLDLRYRIRHIAKAHEDIADWVLTPAEKRMLAGDMSVSAPTVSPDDERMKALEAQVEKLTALLERDKDPRVREAAEEITQNIITGMDVVSAGAGEFLDEDNVPATADSIDSSGHLISCKYHGRFGKYGEGCPKCAEILAKKE